MSIKIEADDGRVSIRADDGSRVSNISVNGRQLVGRRVWLTRHQKLQLVFAAVMGACMLIFIAMLYGVKI